MHSCSWRGQCCLLQSDEVCPCVASWRFWQVTMLKCPLFEIQKWHREFEYVVWRSWSATGVQNTHAPGRTYTRKAEGQSAIHLCTYYTSLSTVRVNQKKREWSGWDRVQAVFVMSFVQEAFSGTDLLMHFLEAQRSSCFKRLGRRIEETVATGGQAWWHWTSMSMVHWLKS